MAAQGHVEDSFTFVGGLNTEGSFFLTPKNCWKDGDNVVPQTNGTVQRRKAIKYETGFSTQSITSDFSNVAYTTHVWNAVNGNGNEDMLVVQIGYRLYFYNALGGATSSRYVGVVNFQTMQAFGNTDNVEALPVQVASSFGDLIVTSQACDPFVVRYVNNVFSIERVTLRVRDFNGVYMPTPITEERTLAEWASSGLQGAALYNLYNQGWNDTQINAYKTAFSDKLPANTKSWIYGKDPNDDFVATTLNKQEFGTSPAPKGRYILDAFNNVRTSPGTTSVTAPSPNWQDNREWNGAVVGDSDTSIYTNYVTARPRACGFFAGRVWYAGINNNVQNGYIYFSQVASSKDRYGKCYQENDPTSEVLSDILDDDGGIIVIPEIGEIVALRGTSNTLVVFASNGIWTIVGGDNGFKASQYIVAKISNVGCVSAETIVEVEDTFMFWSLTGIYAMKVGQLGEGAVQNVSDTNIKSFYDSLAAINRLNAQGVYDYVNKRVEWIIAAGATPTIKHKSLCFDVRLQAWYTYTFANVTNSPKIVGIATTTQAADTTQTLDVVVNTDDVLVNTDQVVTDVNTTSGSASVIKYVVLNSSATTLSFADLLNSDFDDWDTTELPAYVITGYVMGNNGPARIKTAGYITTFLRRTETAFDNNSNPLNESGCFMQTRWDFTDNINPGKWGTEYQVYRLLRPYLVSGSGPFDDGYPLVITKNKVRGRGKALQIKLQAETGKDMQLVGWSATFVGNTNV